MAVWTSAYISSLPDSCFLYIEEGGEKDEEGKTTPRSLRHFPYKDADGKIDLPHLRNALSRIPQSKLDAEDKQKAMNKAQELLAKETGRKSGEPDLDTPDVVYPGLEYKSRVGAIDDVKVDGVVTAMFSVFDIPDDPPPGARPDVVHDGAFAETLVARRGRIDLLHNHNWKAVCGKNLEIWEETSLGAMARSQYNLDTFWGFETFHLIKNGDLEAYSFAFLPGRNTGERKSWDVDADGVRHLYRVSLFELGPTPNAIAVHPAARVIEAKSGLYAGTSFADMLVQAENVLAQLVIEGELLAERRLNRGSQEGRKSLSDDVVDAIGQTAERLDALTARLRDVSNVGGGNPDGDSTTSGGNARKAESLKLRTDLARSRLRELGIITG